MKIDKTRITQVLCLRYSNHETCCTGDGVVCGWCAVTADKIAAALSGLPREHASTKDCWCNPMAVEYNEETGVTIWAHNQIH